jgi:hypothetical protein
LAFCAAAVALSASSALADAISDTLTVHDGNTFTAISSESGTESGFIALPQTIVVGGVSKVTASTAAALEGHPTVFVETDGTISDAVGITHDPSNPTSPTLGLGFISDSETTGLTLALIAQIFQTNLGLPADPTQFIIVTPEPSGAYSLDTPHEYLDNSTSTSGAYTASFESDPEEVPEPGKVTSLLGLSCMGLVGLGWRVRRFVVA